jgi:hypothetical protein
LQSLCIGHLGQLDSLSHDILFQLELRLHLRQLGAEALGGSSLVLRLSLQGIPLGAYLSKPILQPSRFLH